MKTKQNRKRKIDKIEKLCPRVYKFFTSGPDEYKAAKGILGFLFGFALGIVFYFLVMVKLQLPLLYQHILGAVFVLSFAIGYAISSQIRCIILLICPSLFSKNGRSYVGAFAIMYLISGPVENIAKNLGEINRSINCGTELAKNLTKARASITLAPLHSIMDDMQVQAHNIHNITSEVKKAFRPAEFEVYDEKETDTLKSKTNNIDKTQEKSADRVSAIEKKFGDKAKSEEKSDRVEAKYGKKVDYRCEDVFSMGVESCRRLFKDTERKCKKKLPVVGHVLCLPLKLTVFCELARVIPSMSGINCDAMDALNPGFGEEFETAEASANALDESFDVNIQYKIINNPEVLMKRTPEDVYMAVAYEFRKRKERADMFFTLIERVLAFMFLRMLWSAYSYNREYTSKYGHDNNFITNYFKHIDKRRKKQHKTKLLPLKKLEKKTVITPTSGKMTPLEKQHLSTGTIILLLKALVFGLIIFFDKVLHDILLLIKQNSKVHYEQKGTHSIHITVHGTGAMAHLIRTLLTGLNQAHHISQELSNYKCLPTPYKTDEWLLTQIFLILLACWVLLFGQAYALRLRRLIAAFFYRKREKKRILFLYNDMLKKRIGFLSNAKMLIRRRAKDGKLEGHIGILPSIAKRCKKFPKLKKFVDKLAHKQTKCLLCKESIGKKGIFCSTKGCHFAYCKQCWKDIGKNCYACRDDDEWTATNSSVDFNFNNV